jgi:hypothetical protein
MSIHILALSMGNVLQKESPDAVMRILAWWSLRERCRAMAEDDGNDVRVGSEEAIAQDTKMQLAEQEQWLAEEDANDAKAQADAKEQADAKTLAISRQATQSICDSIRDKQQHQDAIERKREKRRNRRQVDKKKKEQAKREAEEKAQRETEEKALREAEEWRKNKGLAAWNRHVRQSGQRSWATLSEWETYNWEIEQTNWEAGQT